MKFEIHKKFRFDFKHSNREYQSALDEYKKHLSTIDFEATPDLLKYFGLSFFHDGLIKTINAEQSMSQLSIIIKRDDDKSDIDSYRKKNGLNEIDWAIYAKNPILYYCQFEGVTSFKFDVEDFNEFYIIDTEIDYIDDNFSISISLSDIKEIQIICKSVKVNLISKDLIKRYTNQLTSELPYCESCRQKLITSKNLKE